MSDARRDREQGRLHVLVDCTPLTEASGGIHAYTANLLAEWSGRFPRDGITVLGTAGLPATIDQALSRNGRVYRIGPGSLPARIAVQQIFTPALAYALRPDAVLTVTPALPVAPLGVPMVSVFHDLGHERHPEQFGLLQRVYRTITYAQSLRRAARLIAISDATLDDVVASYSPAAGKVRAIYHGSDHVLRWRTKDCAGHGLAFARWRNKRPDLAVRAWAELKSRSCLFDRVLHIVSAPSDERLRLQRLALDCGVERLVRIHGELPADEYQRLFASACLVLMPSSYEGFGLPIVEAQRLGIPVVACDSGGMREAGGEAALYAAAGSPVEIAELCLRVLTDIETRERVIRLGRRHAEAFNWQHTADETRAIVLSAAREHR